MAKRALAQRSMSELETRTPLLPFALAARSEVKASKIGAAKTAPIWSFWAQGVHEAPSTVKRALASVASYAGGRDVQVLTYERVRDFVTLPDIFERKREEMGWVKYKNAVKLAVLSQYGGTWIDATCLQVAPMPDAVADADFALFRDPAPDRIISNWFIHTRLGNPLVEAMFDAYRRYWEADISNRPYLAFHYLFEALVTLHAPLTRVLWEPPYLPASEAISLLPLLPAAHNREAVAQSLGRSWLHKLDYKAHGGEGSGLQAFEKGVWP